MTVASYQTIKRLAPIKHMQERDRVLGLTFGLGPCGYDIRCAERVFIEEGGFSLCSSMEEFQMPNNLVGIVHDKSTWARKGVAVQNTVIEPGWCGFLTLELTNHSDDDVLIAAGAPIAQIIFHLLDEPTQCPYSGKYQNQPAGAQPAILEMMEQAKSCAHPRTYFNHAEGKLICKLCNAEVK